MSGHPSALPSMVSAMAHGGRIALLGIASEPVSVDWNHVVFNMLTIKGIYGREMYETWYAMTVMLQSGLDVSPVITHRFPASQHEAAFAAAATGSAAKVIIDWQE
jgi:threonine 3-dehydrogenase